MFYIYERASTYIMGGVNKWDGTVRPDHRKSYKTMPAARAALTRMSKRHRADMLESVNDPQYRFGIAEAEHFHKTIEKSRTVKNMMNDADIVETVNTPGYMSPRSEAYWSM
jgi:hypothetical protein|tara:strand:- start:27 stop:359 length:333 start_codon:yes stop_codon:yes gene_type:complete